MCFSCQLHVLVRSCEINDFLLHKLYLIVFGQHVLAWNFHVIKPQETIVNGVVTKFRSNVS